MQKKTFKPVSGKAPGLVGTATEARTQEAESLIGYGLATTSTTPFWFPKKTLGGNIKKYRFSGDAHSHNMIAIPASLKHRVSC